MTLTFSAHNLSRYRFRYRLLLIENIADMERALVGDPTSVYFRGRLEAFRVSLELFNKLSDDLPELA